MAPQKSKSNGPTIAAIGNRGSRMNWVLIGYVAKRRITRAGWASALPDYSDVGFPCSAPVEEICSVSNCIARRMEADSGPEDATPLGLYDTPDQAWAALPVESRADFALYAYRLWPVQFDNGEEEPIDLWWEPTVEPIAATYVRLGWDAVEGSNGYGFGCSPLSCL